MDFDYQSENQPKRSRSIKPEKLQEKQANGDFDKGMIPVFYRTHKRGLQCLYTSFPREALITFSDKFRSVLLDGGAKYIIVNEADRAAIKEIFDWILQSCNAGEVQEFETYDEDQPGVITRYADIVRVADENGLPARDLQEKIIKRMRRCVKFQREHDRRVDWDDVEDFYENRDEVMCKIVAATIFYSWWYGHLTEQDTPNDMCYLSTLRKNYPQFDQDLRDEFEEQKRYLDDRKKKDSERAATATDADSGVTDNDASASVSDAGGDALRDISNGACDWEKNAEAGGRGWGFDAGNGGDTTGGWGTSNAGQNPSAFKSASNAPNSFGGSGDKDNADWADEMNTASSAW